MGLGSDVIFIGQLTELFKQRKTTSRRESRSKDRFGVLVVAVFLKESFGVFKGFFGGLD